jgi:hypothetical protein
VILKIGPKASYKCTLEKDKPEQKFDAAAYGTYFRISRSNQKLHINL